MRNVYLALKRSVVFVLLLGCVAAFAGPVINSFYPLANTVKTPGTLIDTTNIPDSTAPSIINFWPTSGQQGTAVYILGKNINSATAVRFGGVPADSIVILNDTTIRAIVDTGATGSVSVTTPFGTASKPGFTFIRDTTSLPDSTCPAIVNFWPTSGQKGTAVYILGSNFTSATAVRFGGVLADSIVIMSDTIIKAIVDTGATGSVSVATPYCFASKPGFTFIRDTTNIPDTTVYAIYDFYPKSAQRGNLITIFGSGFTNVYQVGFGGVRADSIAILSDTVIQAIVGNGATGMVSVTSPKGVRYKSGFTFIPDTTTPLVRNFYPTSGRKGTIVQILGKNLRRTTAVRFGGVLADSVWVMSDTTVRARVGNGATGSVSVSTPYGTASKPGFTFIADTTNPDTTVYAIYNFTPKSGQKGTVITIFGSGFTNVYGVIIGNAIADSMVVLSDTVIVARVAANATSGQVGVISPKGSRYLPGFTFIPDTTTPSILNFWPTSGTKGTAVFILGKNIRNATAVSFGGVLADSIMFLNDTTIRAIVDTGATGNVTVYTPYGIASKPGFTYISDTTINDSLFVSARINTSGGTTPKSFVLYPNPASKYVIWQQPVTDHRTRLQLVDISGRIVKQIVVNGNTPQTTIQLSGLRSGVYKLVWIDGKNKLSRTLLIK